MFPKIRGPLPGVYDKAVEFEGLCAETHICEHCLLVGLHCPRLYWDLKP